MESAPAAHTAALAACAGRAERYGISRLLDRRNAVLELPARGSLHDVKRPRFQDYGRNPALGAVRLETHPATAAQRNADDLLKLRHVTMPANRRAGRVFSDDGFDEFFASQACGCGRAPAHGRQELRDCRSRRGFSAAEIVFPAVLHNAAAGDVAVEIKRPKLEASDAAEQACLFGFRQEIRNVGEAFGQRNRSWALSRHPTDLMKLTGVQERPLAP